MKNTIVKIVLFINLAIAPYSAHAQCQGANFSNAIVIGGTINGVYGLNFWDDYNLSTGSCYGDDYGEYGNDDVVLTFTLPMAGIVTLDANANYERSPVVLYLIREDGSEIEYRISGGQYTDPNGFSFSRMLQPGKYYILGEGFDPLPENALLNINVNAVFEAPAGTCWVNPVSIPILDACQGQNVYVDTRDIGIYRRDDLSDAYGVGKGDYPNNIFYKFELARDAEVTITNAISNSNQHQNIYLLDESGTFLQSANHQSIKRELYAGSYYLISEMDWPQYHYDAPLDERLLTTSISLSAPPPLTIDAGADQTIRFPVTTSVSFFGNVSSATCPVTYAWTKQSGPEVTMTGINSNTLTISALKAGQYVFRLTGTVKNTTAYDEVNLTVEETLLQKDSMALVDLYNACDGIHWSANRGWLTGRISSWTGIAVSNNRVTYIDLVGRGVKGKVPSSFGKLTELKELYLSDNKITELPNEIGNCLQLTHLMLDINLLTQLPGSLNNLTKLIWLDLSKNKLTGPIPDWIFNSKNLSYLALNANQFSGNISEKFKDLTNLRELVLEQNKLSGSTPLCFATMPKLNTIELYGNKLTGLGPLNYQSLGTFEIRDNRLDYGDLEKFFINGLPFDGFNYQSQQALQLSFNVSTKTFSIKVGGAHNTFQWKKNGVDIPGATSSTLVLTYNEYQANVEYSCNISNTLVSDLVLYTLPKRPKDQFSHEGDFITQTSGNWNDFRTWQLFDGQYYNDANPGELPNINSPVFIEKGHCVTLTENAGCKDLNLCADPDIVRLKTQENILDVWGQLRLYSKTASSINSGGSVGIPGWINTGTNGRIRLKGNVNRVVTEQNEFSDHINMKGWTLECNLSSNATATIKSNFRTGNLVLTSGYIEVKSKNFKASTNPNQN